MYETVWTPEAESVYYDTLEFWIEHNKSNTFSLKIISEIENMEVLLKNAPFIGHSIDGLSKEVRRVVVLNHFSLFYTVNDMLIQIVSFWESHRNPDELKL